VKRTQHIESLENHQRQGALQDVRFLFHNTAILVSNRKGVTLPLGKQQVNRPACRGACSTATIHDRQISFDTKVLGKET